MTASKASAKARTQVARRGGLRTLARAQMTSIGRHIRRLRERHGRSLKELSRSSGVSVTTIQRIESGDINPGLLTVVCILDALNIAIDDFIGLAQNGNGSVQVVRSDEQTLHQPRFVEHTIGDIADPRLQTRLLSLPPHTDMVAYNRGDGGPHFGFVVDGKVRLIFHDNSTFELSIGDAIHVINPTLKLMGNPTGKPARLLWIGGEGSTAKENRRGRKRERRGDYPR